MKLLTCTGALPPDTYTAYILGPAQREQAKTPISQGLPEKGSTTQFCCWNLRVQFIISLYLDADCDPQLWDIAGF